MRVFVASLAIETNTFSPLFPSDPSKVPYTKLRRPIYPLDPHHPWL